MAVSDARRRRGERAQAVPLVVGLVAVAALVVLALVPVVRAAVARSEAQTAADLAALAGAAEGEAAARELAEANDAELVEFRSRGTDVWVVVELDEARAEARARREG